MKRRGVQGELRLFFVFFCPFSVFFFLPPISAFLSSSFSSSPSLSYHQSPIILFPSQNNLQFLQGHRKMRLPSKSQENVCFMPPNMVHMIQSNYGMSVNKHLKLKNMGDIPVDTDGRKLGLEKVVGHHKCLLNNGPEP